MRCFTILLASGWLLFKPPFGNVETGVMFDDSRPLSEWTVTGGFDTAKECNNKIEEGVQLARQFFSARENSIKEWRETGKIPPTFEFYRSLCARCIPSDTIGFKFK